MKRTTIIDKEQNVNTGFWKFSTGEPILVTGHSAITCEITQLATINSRRCIIPSFEISTSREVFPVSDDELLSYLPCNEGKVKFQLTVELLKREVVFPINSCVFDRFERDILYDSHGTYTKIDRSKAANFILAQEETVLSLILKYLVSPEAEVVLQKDGLQGMLQEAWSIILVRFVMKHEIEGSPLKGDDFKLWIDWLREFE